MITVMLSGSISKQPETRTSAKGNSYAVATIRTGEGDDAVFVSVTAFGDLADTLAGLQKGDSACVVGTGKIGTYEAKDGSGTKASLSITASRIVALVDHQSRPRAGTTPRRPTPGIQAPARPMPPVEAYNDQIPF